MPVRHNATSAARSHRHLTNPEVVSFLDQKVNELIHAILARIYSRQYGVYVRLAVSIAIIIISTTPSWFPSVYDVSVFLISTVTSVELELTHIGQ